MIRSSSNYVGVENNEIDFFLSSYHSFHCTISRVRCILYLYVFASSPTM